MIPDLDPRFLLARADLAEQALEGLVPAARYRETQAYRCLLGFAPILDASGEKIGEILFGEAFDVLETVDGRCWGRARRDGTVGYMDLDLLGPLTDLPTRRVASTEATLPFNALVSEADPVEPEHLVDFRTFDPDLATSAERLLGAPYRWRGRARAGVDCGGLVQQALLGCGWPAPRPSDMQARLGRPVGSARRGDLIVWVGHHVAIAVNDTDVIHACPDAGQVRLDSFEDVDSRWQSRGASAPDIRRL